MFKAIAEWGFSDFASAIGGLFILIFFIMEAIKKAVGHTEWYKQRQEERDKKKKEADHAQYKEFTDEFVNQFVPPLVERFEQSDKQILEKLDTVITSSNDLLRNEMTTIYYRYLPYKKILQYDKKQFMRLMEDYKAQKGNSYIDEIWKEIQNWTVVESKDDLIK